MERARDKIEDYSKTEILKGLEIAINKTKEEIERCKVKGWDQSEHREHLKGLAKQLEDVLIRN